MKLMYALKVAFKLFLLGIIPSIIYFGLVMISAFMWIPALIVEWLLVGILVIKYKAWLFKK